MHSVTVPPMHDDDPAALTGRRGALLDQLTDLFLARGIRGFTLEDLATELSCSKSTLYALAPSKEQLAARVVEYFFRRAARRVETQVARRRSPAARVREYLLAVAGELSAASPTFLADVAANALTRGSYERHTAIAADRIRALVAAGVESGDFRAVDPVFLGEVVAAGMDAIERGGVTSRTGLTHAEAYAQLAALVLAAVRTA
ncbi:TetR/AcrR family transcriptional regulator [Jatrophihabitans sp. YIM 134969]